MFSFISKIFASFSLFRTAFFKYKKMLAVLTALGFLSGLVGGIGISAIIPLFSFISNKSGIVADSITNIFESTFRFLHIPFSLPIVLTILVLLFAFKAVFLYFANYINAKVATEYEAETRDDLFRHTLRANWPYLIDRKIGHLSQMITEDVDVSGNILTGLSMVILFLTSFITYALVAIKISFYITILTVVIGILVFLVMKPLFYRIRMLSKQAAKLNKDVAHNVNQHLIGAKTVKSMAVEQKVMRGGSAQFRELAESKLNRSRYSNILSTFLEPLTLAVIIPVFLFSYKNPNFNIASFAAILYLVEKMFSFVQNIQIRSSIINQNIPHLVAVMNHQAEAKKSAEQSGGEIQPRFNHVLKFENVEFYYKSEEKVLDGLNFEIKKGEMLGLIGSSGSGKTTITDLVLRLLNPKTGRITLDGVNIAETNLDHWRRNIGYVSQEIFLLNDTIANNIRFYDETISENDIIQAAKLANIYDFIVKQPEGFNTQVGERGLKLSAGQRQRIVLARIISRKPEILILDEATSALDNESEVAIQKALESLRGSVTMLIVAHRLSTIVDADRLIVLERGKIVEEGVPRQLLNEKDSHFYKIYNIREE